MSNRLQALAQQLTGKNSIDECSIDELKHIVRRHPYFAPAQFLLLQKLRISGSEEEAEAQYRKAVLFYHDPLLFEHFISSNKFYTEEAAYITSKNTGAAIFVEPEEKQTDAVAGVESAEILEITGDPLEEFDVDENKDPSDETTIRFDEPQQTEQVVVLEEDEMVQTDAVENQLMETAVDTSDTVEEIQPLVENNGATQETNTATQTPNTDLAFEPFHTVDYFASQGIKITADEAPKDKLGKQLKSFTEWLRTMKRLPSSQIAEAGETSAEKKVETLADRSVSESDVVTEAMAEVWLKQGNNQKALDIYNKLSLQNPSKKAYFAAKIENLKLS